MTTLHLKEGVTIAQAVIALSGNADSAITCVPVPHDSMHASRIDLGTPHVVTPALRRFIDEAVIYVDGEE